MAAEPEAESSPNWSYSGANGPAHWGSIDPAYSACSTGAEQSPIDLTRAARRALPGLQLSLKSATFQLHNNGHSVEARAAASGGVNLGGVAYTLLQFHYHAPSEHRVDGRSFPLELHLVTRSASGQLLVLGVLIKRGRSNPAFARLLAALPKRQGEHAKLTRFDALSLLPAGGRGLRYAYGGSLTTPPCTEGVRWNVFAAPVALSAAQIRALTSIYSHTNRPIQPRNGRALVLGGGATC